MSACEAAELETGRWARDHRAMPVWMRARARTHHVVASVGKDEAERLIRVVRHPCYRRVKQAVLQKDHGRVRGARWNPEQVEDACTSESTPNTGVSGVGASVRGREYAGKRGGCVDLQCCHRAVMPSSPPHAPHARRRLFLQYLHPSSVVTQ